VRIATVGGGPGGLYSSLLLKKANPALDIRVYERNSRGATYGWGVVFSDTTLTSFREADYKTYVDITDQFVMWDAIDVRVKGEVVRCEGQAFSGITRRGLLDILQQRCEELGVELEFEADAAMGGLDGFDLVIAADGINSATREARARDFRPRIQEGRSRYIWYGTTRPFDSFTFIFRSNEDGLFQVHAYPFDGRTSTFIVECDEESWRAAELNEATEQESIAYCEKVFADDLRGHPLMSNQSKWIRFPTLTTRKWRALGEQTPHVVLLGDAAHTAHFSIGSGTKLAMEDAAALAHSVSEHDDLAAALADYEFERRPVVERFQEAARQSQSYFESTRRYLHLDPEQFVFHLLTRSGRIDYGGLKLRDPHLVERVDRWFERDARSALLPVVAPPPAFTSLQLRTRVLQNRIVLALGSSDTAAQGVPDGAYLEQLDRALASGAGLVLTDEIAVAAHGRISPGCAGLYRSDQVDAWARVVRPSRPGTAVGIRLNHAGPRGATKPRHLGLDRPLDAGAWPLLSASPVAYGGNRAPLELSDEMSDVIEDFVTAAGYADAAGFDVLVVEMARGYFLGSFLSPLTNRRADGYGGALERRLRLPLEVFDVVRRAWPDKPLGASVCATDWAAGGAEIDDALTVVRALKSRGCDFVEVTAGWTTADFRPLYDPYFITSYSDRIRNECGMCTLVGGSITTTDRVNTIVGGGRADLCIFRPRA
jgi:anthraniloyl-CoA monooxygenase